MYGVESTANAVPAAPEPRVSFAASVFIKYCRDPLNEVTTGVRLASLGEKKEHAARFWLRRAPSVHLGRWPVPGRLRRDAAHAWSRLALLSRCAPQGPPRPGIPAEPSPRRSSSWLRHSRQQTPVRRPACSCSRHSPCSQQAEFRRLAEAFTAPQTLQLRLAAGNSLLALFPPVPATASKCGQNKNNRNSRHKKIPPELHARVSGY